MDQTDRQLEASFHQMMLDTYDAATRLKPPYRPTEFRRMVAEHGGRETANRLLAGGNPSSGFTELYLRGKENLRLSVEYLVLQSPWRSLFRPDQLEVARRRLRDVEFDLPNEDAVPKPEDWRIPEEIDATEQLTEGAVRTVTVNAYERSPEARARCISHFGLSCTVCGFNFGQVYGDIAEGYIHVHHLTPLATLKQNYIVDPVKDLRPVCANCHSVIHLGGGCRSIDEVRKLLTHRQA